MTDAIIRTAVVGIAEACVTDQDARLRALLVAAIADVQSRAPQPAKSGASSLQFSRAN
jgi:hypothetical protein